LTKVNEEGQGERNLEREPPGSRPGDITVQPGLAVIRLREELPKIVSDLSREQLEELVRNLREGFLGRWPIGADYGAELARLIEPTAPELAKQMRSLKSPQDITKWLELWLVVLEVVLAVMAPNQIVINIDHDQTTINIEHNERTTIVNPPPAPPTGEGPNG
jgi:hypothetical protein